MFNINLETSLKSDISSDSNISNSKNSVKSLCCSNISYDDIANEETTTFIYEILIDTLLFLFLINLKAS